MVVYTIAQESRYLTVYNVPSLNIRDELLSLFALYGAIDEYRILDDLPSEPFTDIYWIKYQLLSSARMAKKKMNDYSFFGQVLRVSYSPESESVEDTRKKLAERRESVSFLMNRHFGSKNANTKTQTQIQPQTPLINPSKLDNQPPISNYVQNRQTNNQPQSNKQTLPKPNQLVLPLPSQLKSLQSSQYPYPSQNPNLIQQQQQPQKTQLPQKLNLPLPNNQQGKEQESNQPKKRRKI